MKKLILFLFVIFSSGLTYSQAEVIDTIKYTFYLELFGNQHEVFSDQMVEGDHFTIEAKTLPAQFADLQPMYDALVTSELGLEVGSLDRNIQMNIVLGGINANKRLIVEGQPLFMYFRVDIIDLKTGEWYDEYSSFYFLNGKGAFLNINVTNAFLAFAAANGIDINQGISFAYLIKKPDGTEVWTPVGITWNLDQTKTPWVINAKLIHFSKFGGGGKTLSTDLTSSEIFPDQFTLSQNYPNPFNPSTIIKYNLPESGNVSLKIFNSLGREVSVLENGYRSAGEHSVEFNSKDLSTGTYFYTISFNGKVHTRKMLLIK